MNKSQKVTLCVVLLIVLLIAWGLFPLFFKWLMIGIGSKETALKDFGTFGDIYGSLNTLFTSATLIIVMYSAYLQRQANQDAREAMEKQLQQAKEDTENQLKQACEATEQQILNAQRLADIQLKQSMEVSTKQLELAQATHQEQLKESQISIFKSQFFSLLDFKNDKFKELSMCNKDGIEVNGYNLFDELFKKLNDKLIIRYIENIDLIDEKIIRSAFDESCQELNNNENYYEILIYLEIYAVIIKLINSSKADQDSINFYGDILRVSISKSEQFCIFLLAPMWDRLYSQIKLVAFFNTFGTTKPYEEFAFKFYQKGNFALEMWQEAFEKKEQNQTPT